jgi:hypothetical protein
VRARGVGLLPRSVRSTARGAAPSTRRRRPRSRVVTAPRSPPSSTLFLGPLRPLVGSIFGIALYFAVDSGLLEIFAVPKEEPQKLFFLLVIAFLAGFSERWAQETLSARSPFRRPVGRRVHHLRPSVRGTTTAETGCPDRAQEAATLRRPGAIAQLGERLDRTQEVVGSSPTSSIRSLSE